MNCTITDIPCGSRTDVGRCLYRGKCCNKSSEMQKLSRHTEKNYREVEQLRAKRNRR